MDAEIKYLVSNALKNEKATWEWSIMNARVTKAGIITYTVRDVKAIVCYHIRRNRCAYLSYRKTMLSKSSL